ncbi:MAG: PepSY domain-containing protein [Acidobacteria bacterium]|nr:PepSY domain-containing protein [Acidobacteriota bacterium]MCB9397530.1 PepSY domain-containing protein [Acidobacteriota bacterium]
MIVRKIHRMIGLFMTVPFFAWALTGFVFFIRPGYGPAYASLPIKKYPMAPTAFEGSQEVLAIQTFRTILGIHHLVETSAGAEHWLDGNRIDTPDESLLRLLLEDAISADPARYGQLESLTDESAQTTTGVNLTWNWSQMRLYQSGKDTRLIDMLYKIHYLQWTGLKWVDRILGVVGLLCVLALAIAGLLLWRRSRT